MKIDEINLHILNTFETEENLSEKLQKNSELPKVWRTQG